MVRLSRSRQRRWTFGRSLADGRAMRLGGHAFDAPMALIAVWGGDQQG
jgi:hypothetical protein